MALLLFINHLGRFIIGLGEDDVLEDLMHLFEVIVEVETNDTLVSWLAAVNSWEISLDGVEDGRVVLSEAAHHCSEIGGEVVELWCKQLSIHLQQDGKKLLIAILIVKAFVFWVKEDDLPCATYHFLDQGQGKFVGKQVNTVGKDTKLLMIIGGYHFA